MISHAIAPARQLGVVTACLCATIAQPVHAENDETAVFTVRTAVHGLDYRNICGDPPQLPILDQNGQGVALIDYDDDGLIDILLPTGSSLARVKEGQHPGPRLYRNLGTWRFEDVSVSTVIDGVIAVLGARFAMGTKNPPQ